MGAPAGLSLGDITLRAYGRTLERHHSRIERMLVRRTMFLLPSREELYGRLGYDETEYATLATYKAEQPSVVQQDLERCVQEMAPGLRELDVFFTKHDLGA